MFDALWLKLGGVALVLALLGGGYVWAHHQGALSQYASDQAEIDHKNDALHAAAEALTAAANTFDRINADAEAQLAAAKLSAQRSQRVMADAQRKAAAGEAAAAAWQRKFKAAVASPPCASMMEQTLCPAVFETPPAPSSR